MQQLESLSLSNNPRLGGPLQASWGQVRPPFQSPPSLNSFRILRLNVPSFQRSSHMHRRRPISGWGAAKFFQQSAAMPMSPQAFSGTCNSHCNIILLSPPVLKGAGKVVVILMNQLCHSSNSQTAGRLFAGYRSQQWSTMQTHDTSWSSLVISQCGSTI